MSGYLRALALMLLDDYAERDAAIDRLIEAQS